MTTVTVSAEAPAYIPYYSYEYNSDDKSIAAPAGYEVSSVLKADSLGVDLALNAPSDIYYDNAGTFYLLDSGNGRIILMNAEMKARKILNTFTDSTGLLSKVDITGAQGVCADANGRIYIADTNNQRILITDQEGRVLRVITRPENAMLDSAIPFSVNKIMTDKDGRIYALAKSVNLGAFIFDSDGNFLNFWGSNTVTKTAEVLFNYFRKNFMSAEQIAGMKQATPVSFTNFDIDSKGFVYTVTDNKDKDAATKTGAVRVLNFQGRDTLPSSIVFGDLEGTTSSSENAKTTVFSDVDVDSQGFINLLDIGRGKVFQYSENGDLLTVFGTYSEQQGGFGAPEAIESYGDCVYVVDSQKNCITVFRQTQYATLLRAAVSNLKSNNMSQAFDYFQKVHMLNSNSLYPYHGMGIVYDAQGDYVKAMEYFKIADAKEEYSQTFKEYRSQYFNQNSIGIMIGAFALIAVIIAVRHLIRKKLKNTANGDFSVLERKSLFPFYTLFHPVDGFDQFKPRKIASYRIGTALVALWFVIQTLKFFLNGYCFNDNKIGDYNIFITFASTVGMFFLFVLSNWGACALLDGKGTFKDIFCTCAYSMIPMLTAFLINIALSNICSLDEAVYLGLVNGIGLIWTGLLLVCGLMTIHQYSLKKTIASLAITVLGMLIIIFLIVLFFSLVQQIYNFIISVYTEASLR